MSVFYYNMSGIQLCIQEHTGHDGISMQLLKQLELVYLPKGKYCVYPRMVYRLAPGIMTFFTLKMTLRVIPHPSYLGKDSFHTEEAT